MKQIYFLLIALCFITTTKAQIVDIPDANFKAKLLAASSSNTIAKDLAGNYFKIDANGDGEIQVSEALQVSYLSIIFSAISDLTGILSFSNLNYLYCDNNNKLTALDVHSLPNLKVLSCRNNVLLTSCNVSNLITLTSLDCTNSHLTTLNVSSLTNLVELICTNNQLVTLDVGSLIKLETLFCSLNKISSLDLSSLTNITDLDCTQNQISSLDLSKLTNITYLYCDNNQLSQLDLNGLTKLKVLRCSNNILSSLDVSNLTILENLYCGANKISSLDINSLTALTEVDCYKNQLATLNVNGLTKLKKLHFSQNKISAINLVGLTQLESLDYSNTQISILDISFLTNLISLYCSQNQISSLDLKNLTKLERLYCQGNKITSLDISNLTKLTQLSVSNNPLNSLDIINLINLRDLTCSYTNLSNLLLPKLSILNLDCSNNSIQSLDLSMVSRLNSFTCSNNNLSYLCVKNGAKDNPISFDNNPSGLYICADDSEIESSITYYSSILPNYNSYTVNSYCSFVPGGTNYTIKGNQKLDSNANGCDVFDSVVSNLKFNIAKGAALGSFVCDSTGNYSIPVQAGTHIITPVIENPTYFNISPTTSTITFPTQTSPFIQNFCITPNGNHPDLEITLLPLQPASPGFDAKYKLVYKNKGNTTQSGYVNLNFNDAVLDLVVANPVTTTQTINNLSWNFTSLLPFETREITFTLNVNSPIEIPEVNSGAILPYFATITSAATDETPIDNTFAFNQTVVNSFDPNDKTCLEGTTISPSLIGQYVHYMIRFENNGTANAKNIVVKDMIDLSKFDISTLIPTNASHSFVTNITAGNKVEFIFENINLPFDDANNDGYIAFKIKTLPTLKVGDTFTNDASIYFDYNFPVVTKPASSTFKTLGTTDFEFTTYFTLYPNPVKSVLNISLKETIEVKSISIYNTLGQLVLVVPNAEKVSKIDVSSLTTGNYFIKINSDKGSSNARFIKE